MRSIAQPQPRSFRRRFARVAACWLVASCAFPVAPLTAAPATAPGTPRVFLLDASYLQAARQRLKDGDQS